MEASTETTLDRNELAVSCWPLAVHLACRYRSQVRLHMDDRLSAASAGLMRAAETFDASRGVPFVSWAAFHIRRAMDRAMNDRVVRIPAWAHNRKGVVEKLSPATRASARAITIPIKNPGSIASHEHSPIDSMLSAEQVELLRSAVRSLPSAERYVLSRRYGLHGSDSTSKRPTFAQLGRELGVVAGTVCKLEKRALRRLRAVLGPELAAG